MLRIFFIIHDLKEREENLQINQKNIASLNLVIIFFKPMLKTSIEVSNAFR
jgi:hypothetical protein